MRLRVVRGSIALVAVAVAATLTACSRDTSTPTTTTTVAAGEVPNCGGQELTFITSTSGFLFMPAFVAESAGYYEKVGVKPKKVTIPGTQASLSALINGDANFSFTSAQAVITAINEGAPLIMVGGINRQLGSNVVVRKDIVDSFLSSKGATSLDAVKPEERVEMLKGLRIGITEPGAGSDQVVRFMLRRAGMNPDTDARITGLGSSNSILSAFATRRIDAFALSSPTDTLAVAKHDGVLVLNLAQGEYPPLNPYFYESIVTSKRFASNNPQAVACVVTAIAMAEKLLAENPTKAAEVARTNEVFKQIEDEIYQAGFQTNLGSWYENPVVGEADVRNVFDFVRDAGEDIKLSFADVVDNSWANAAAEVVKDLDVTPVAGS